MKRLMVLSLIVLLAGVCLADVTAVYRTSPPTLTNGTYSPLCVDSSGNLKTAATSTAMSRYRAYATTAEGVVKSSSGSIFSLYAHNENPSARYIQLFNSASLPTAGTTPEYSFVVAGSGTLFVDSFFGVDYGTIFTTGIVWAASTTEPTFEAAAGTDEVVFINYK